ncbi:MAG TPA: hypothetical protein VK894_11565 [Jiangellales bacterium]|nr:hypothetical protein [Jiangellales bacterium]
MPLFRRKQAATAADPRPAIAGFWAWWEGARADVAAALADGEPQRAAPGIAAAVRAVGELDWELAAGTEGARHGLVVSAGGKPELRALAQRWWLAAPPADETFEYHPARQRDTADSGRTLVVDDFELPTIEFVAGTRYDEQRGRLDLAVHHPLFPLLGDESRLRATFLALDSALGEDDVERFVGSVHVAVDQPVDAVPLSSLGPLVDGLRPAGGAAWALFQGSTRKGPVVGTIRRPFSRVDRPLADTHVAVELRYASVDQGMPAVPDFAEQVARWEQQAVAALGGDGEHVGLAGHETGLGRCLGHLYVDGLTVDPAALDPVLAGWPHGPARTHVTHDPAWRAIGHLLA